MNDSARPLVSVVIPTYNHARYLGRALQSVLNQSYTNWEAIVIDNHSTDNTDEVVTSFADSRIIYFKIHNDGVIAASRNFGIRAAKGEWIAFLDSDDCWTENKLQACLNCTNDKVDLVYHDLQIVTDRARFFWRNILRSWQVEAPVLIDLITRGNAISSSSVVVRANIIKLIGGMSENIDLVGAEDYNTWLRIAQLSEGFIYLPKQLGFYQVHNQSISSRKDMSMPCRHAIAEFMNLLSPRQEKMILSNIEYTRGRFQYTIGNYASAKNSFTNCLNGCSNNIKLKAAYMWLISLIYTYTTSKDGLHNPRKSES